MKTRPDALGTVETSQGEQNMKTRPDALSTVENEYQHAKHEYEIPRLITH
jgi:hypothetical protein